MLASVNDVFNAVFVRGDIVGDTLFYGRGAGKDATASAVLSDMADAALDLKPWHQASRCRRSCRTHAQGAVRRSVKSCRGTLSGLNVVDRPGVLAKIAAIFGRTQHRHFLGHPTGRP